MGWREALADYLASKLPSASGVEVVNVQGMPAGASNDTVSFASWRRTTSRRSSG